MCREYVGRGASLGLVICPLKWCWDATILHRVVPSGLSRFYASVLGNKLFCWAPCTTIFLGGASHLPCARIEIRPQVTPPKNTYSSLAWALSLSFPSFSCSPLFLFFYSLSLSLLPSQGESSGVIEQGRIHFIASLRYLTDILSFTCANQDFWV